MKIHHSQKKKKIQVGRLYIDASCLKSHLAIFHKTGDAVLYGRLSYRWSPMNYSTQYATPTLVLNSRPSHVTCFGQQVISKSETSRDLICTCTMGLETLKLPCCEEAQATQKERPCRSLRNTSDS